MEILLIGGAVTGAVILFFYLRGVAQAKRFDDLGRSDRH
jgi:hypothetical protein